MIICGKSGALHHGGEETLHLVAGDARLNKFRSLASSDLAGKMDVLGFFFILFLFGIRLTY